MTDSAKLDLLLEKVIGMDVHLDKVDTRLDGIDTRLDKVDARLDGIDTRLDKVDARLDGIDTRLYGVDVRLDKMEKDIIRIDFTLENEIKRNIQLLAENHGNLIDKLNEAIKVADKTVLYEVKFNALTGRIEKLERGYDDIIRQMA